MIHISCHSSGAGHCGVLALLVLILCMPTGRAQEAAPPPPVIHVFGVYCTAYDGDLGRINSSVASDQRLVNNLLQENVSEAVWNVKLEFTTVTGVEATQDNIMNRFKEVAGRVKAADTLYIHFSGHGAIREESGMQILLTCDEKDLDRAAWAKEIEGLNCRLKILITDSCSDYLRIEVAEGDEEVQPWNSLHGLLMRHRGFVNITAASPGQFAYCTQVGSYLTVNLHSDMQRYPSWTEVFAHTQQRVKAETTGAKFPRGPQEPLAFGLGEPIAAGGAEGRVPDYILPDSNRRLLTRADLRPLKLPHLYLARNEIFARYGQDFRTPALQTYFKSKDWYRLRPAMSDPGLSGIEQKNVDLIRTLEREQGGVPVGADRGVRVMFPHSSRQILDRWMLESLSPKDRSIARNEIYARYGYRFRNAKLRSYFYESPGTHYRLRPGTAEPAFSAVERQNMWLIEKIERIRGGAFDWDRK